MKGRPGGRRSWNHLARSERKPNAWHAPNRFAAEARAFLSVSAAGARSGIQSSLIRRPTLFDDRHRWPTELGVRAHSMDRRVPVVGRRCCGGCRCAHLSGRLAAAARALIEWALGRNPRLNEVRGSRILVLEEIAELRRNSPLGKRWLETANALSAKYPSAQPYNVAPGMAGASAAVPILENAIGRPLNELTIQLVQALGPSVIRIVARGDSLPCGREPGAVTIRLGTDGYTVEEITWAVAVPVKQAGERIEGVLYDYFETGAEGVMWSLMDDENLGREGLHFIEAGDHLTICDPLGHEKWSGTIRCDRRAGWRPYPANPEHGQPAALGCWIHWTQRGFTPDQWARFFVQPDVDRFRGILVKKDVP